ALLWGGGALLFSSYLTWRHFPSTSGSGVSGIKVAITVFNGKISIKDTIAKFVTSIFSLSSGLSIGPEGPMVTVNAGVGAWLGHFFSLSKARIKALVAV